MSNSPLVSHVRLSPNYSRRTTNNIDRITPHHTAGVVSIETLGGIFVPVSRKASSTYGIGYDGRVGLFVDEANRPWTSSSTANDDRAITIEVSNSQVGGQWPVSDAAYKSLVNLCVDICQRHGKKKLLFLGDKGTTLAYQPKPDEMVLTMHKWFWATSCPGPYLESRFPQLAAEVTQRLNPKKEEEYLDMTKEELEKYVDARIKAKLEGVGTEPPKWAVDNGEFEEAKKLKITDGTRPQGYATRAEVAAMVLRDHKNQEQPVDMKKIAEDVAKQAVSDVMKKVKEAL